MVDRINSTAVANNRLNINLNNLKTSAATVESQKLTVYLGALAKVRSLSVTTSSYQTTINESTAERTSVATTVCPITISNLSTVFLGTASTIGKIAVSDSDLTNATLATTKGNLTITDSTFHGLQAATATGEFTIDKPVNFSKRIRAYSFRKTTITDHDKEGNDNSLNKPTFIQKFGN